MKKHYTIDDLSIHVSSAQRLADGSTSHEHEVVFARPLTAVEQQKFRSMLLHLYETCEHFGGTLPPEISFTDSDRAAYTLHSMASNGIWSDLEFAGLAEFSAEVVEIKSYDGNGVFERLAGLYKQRRRAQVEQLRQWMKESDEQRVPAEIAEIIGQLIAQSERWQLQ